MKTKLLSSILCFMAFFTTDCHAQFNTIGTYNHKRIKTTNPPKSQEAPRDSVMMTESESEPVVTFTENVGNGKLSVSYPLKNIHIGSGFGMRFHPIYHKNMMHNGVDLTAYYEPVFSMFPGTVIRVGYDNRSGKFVTVQTGNYTISYCHLSMQYVKVGDYVNAGDIISVSGNTGASTGPHLHLTTKKDGKAINPVILLEFVKSFREIPAY